mmetsp:Transcript_112077/g.250411  ORF Transcript_112077/g.250411 Transcript_112077/m.250411 type:complete len:208 (+) Transcript_112077:92-715(+)
MTECSVCRVDYHSASPEVRLLASAKCEHRICESCITRLFCHGRAQLCPVCGQSSRAEDYSVERTRGFQDVLCRTGEDSPSAEDYGEYLLQRGGTVYRLLGSAAEEDRGVSDLHRLLRSPSDARAKCAKVLGFMGEECGGGASPSSGDAGSICLGRWGSGRLPASIAASARPLRCGAGARISSGSLLAASPEGGIEEEDEDEEVAEGY